MDSVETPGAPGVSAEDVTRIRRRVALFFFMPMSLAVVLLVQAYVNRQTAQAELERVQLEEQLRTAPVVTSVTGRLIRRGEDAQGRFVDIAFRGVKSRKCLIVVESDDTGTVRPPPGSVLDTAGLWWGLDSVFPVGPDGAVRKVKPRNVPVEVGEERSYGTWRFRAPEAMTGPIVGALLTVSHQCGEYRVETPFGPTYLARPSVSG